MTVKNLFAMAAVAALTACSSGPSYTASYEVIPKPQETVMQQNAFSLNRRVAIAYPEKDALLKRNAEFLAEYVKETTGISLKVKPLAENETAPNAIVLSLNPVIESAEGYQLTINEKGVNIEGQTAQGVFYGIQTLRKSLPVVEKAGSIELPAVSISDAPRFGYRGMHLDVCRHFFPLDFVKRYIDMIALHNMNTFHWHLTEDQGWRIEIEKYPKLVEVGSTRKCTVIGHNTDEYDNQPVSGYYTKAELKEIVAYAAERYITVIPEVDLPGHMLAALAAYPELGCTGGPYEVSPRWGVFEDVLCIGNDKTMQFLEDVMAEVIEIFPSEYIHIGGDEAPRERWKHCPKCQKRIKDEGLKATNGHTAEDCLQSYCMERIEKFLNERGRQIIGWDEILEGNVAPNATVMSWRGAAGGIKAAQMGHDVIMTPNSHCYFDYYQSKDKENEPMAIGGYLPVEKVYSLEPTEGIPAEYTKHVLGAQGNLWTEYIPTSEQVEYMVLPRMAALSEVQWTSPAKKEYDDFLKRAPHLAEIYQHYGWNYAKHIFHPQTEEKKQAE